MLTFFIIFADVAVLNVPRLRTFVMNVMMKHTDFNHFIAVTHGFQICTNQFLRRCVSLKMEIKLSSSLLVSSISFHNRFVFNMFWVTQFADQC